MRRPQLPRPSLPKPRLGSVAKRLWWGRSVGFRRRAAAVLLVLGIYALIRFVSLPGLPCEVSPAEECPPGDDAISYVPAEAYAYAHLNLDRDSEQFEQAADLAAELPHFAAIAQGTFRALGPGAALDVGIDVYPWLGDEAAAAAVAGPGGSPRPLLVLAVGDESGARAFVNKVAGAPGDQGERRGVEVTSHDSGLASAEDGDFLLLGDPIAVRAAIDTAAGAANSLEDAERAQALLDRLPEDRLADAYVSEDGIDRLLAGRGGVAAQLDTFTDFGASEAIAAAVVARDAGLEVDLRSSLDPSAVRASPSFFSAFPPFDPSLAGSFGADALAMLAVGDPSQTIEALLDQADAAVPGIADAFDRLNADLAADGGTDIEDDLLPVLTGEAAIAVSPSHPVPYVTAVFDAVEEARAREAVARLQSPLIAALDPARTGQAPTFSSRQVDGVTVQSLRLGAGLHLAYAVFDEKLVVATNPRGVEQAIDGDDDLAGTDGYQAVANGAPDDVSALLFLNLDGLVHLAEPRGLAEIVSDFSEDLARLRALGVTVRSRSDSLETELFLNIEEPKEPSS